MCKVAVIGNAGGGKSVLCKILSRSTHLPVFAVDKIQWKPGWQPSPQEEVEEKLNALIRQDRWIIDGWGPWGAIEKRFEQADTIIFVDHPVWIHYWWAFKRQIKAVFFPARLNKPQGCNLLLVTGKMFKMIRRIHKQIRPKLLDMVKSYEGQKRVIHIRSPKELRQFCRDVQK